MKNTDKLNENIQELKKQLHILKKTKILKKNNLNDGEEIVLKLISKYRLKTEKNPTAVEISNLLGITQATITPMINNLIKNDMITREISETDKRAKLLSLTDKGKKKIKLIMLREQKKYENLLTNLGENDSNELIRILEKINKYLSEIK